MSLIRKARRVGSSIVITIPSQVAEAYDIKEGTTLDISLENRNIILKKRDDKIG